MNNPLYETLLPHVGHDVSIVTYGDTYEYDEPLNISIECLECCEVLYSIDKDEPNHPGLDYFVIVFRVIGKESSNLDYKVKQLDKDTQFELIGMSELKKGDVFIMAQVIASVPGRPRILSYSFDRDPYKSVYYMTESPCYSLPTPYMAAPLKGALPDDCWDKCVALYEESDICITSTREINATNSYPVSEECQPKPSEEAMT